MEESQGLDNREIDMLVAQNVLHHQVIVQKKGTVKEKTRQGHLRPLRAYSRDVAAAWEVAERLGITLVPIENGQWFALVGRGERWKSPAELIAFLQEGKFHQGGAALSESPAMAVCLAALTSLNKPGAQDDTPPSAQAS